MANCCNSKVNDIMSQMNTVSLSEKMKKPLSMFTLGRVIVGNQNVIYRHVSRRNLSHSSGSHSLALCRCLVEGTGWNEGKYTDVTPENVWVKKIPQTQEKQDPYTSYRITTAYSFQ